METVEIQDRYIKKAVGGAPRIGPATEGGHGVSLVPSEGPFREGMPDQHGRTLGKRTVAAVAMDAGPQEESVTIGNGLYLLGRIGGNGVSFLVDQGCPSWRHAHRGNGAARRTS